MLTPRENLLAMLRCGKPERYPNQFDAFNLQWCLTPHDVRYPQPEYGGPPVPNALGVTFIWPEGTPGAFPIHDEAHTVIKDIENWRDYVKMPDLNFSQEEWDWIEAEARKVDRKEQFVTAFAWPGLLEYCHHLMGIEECMVAFYTNPEEMHELIDFLTEFELKLAGMACDHYHPDALYRQDDWGTQQSTFISKEMFREFFLAPTKRIYDYWRSRGVEVIIHHSDSYCETFVPEMIEMGIDIWQGALTTNNIPKIIHEYGDKIAIMGCIDNGRVDRADWTKEAITEEVRRVCQWAGTRSFIPNTTYGAPMSTYEGVYEAVTEAIDKMSQELF